jgi:hypothetical protein
MKIQLTEHYQAVGGMQIAPGIYDLKDPVLRGKGKYLVETGHAIAIEDDGHDDTEDIAIALTMGELDTEDAPVIVEPLPLAVDDEGEWKAEDVVTQERTFTPKPKSKR